MAELLLSSLDTLSEAEIEQLWFQEAARRAAEMDQGLVPRIPSEVVRQEAQALLKVNYFFNHRRELSTLNTSLTTSLSKPVLVCVTLVPLTRPWSKFAKRFTGIGSSSLQIFGAIACQAFRTTFSTGRWVLTLRSWSSLRTVVARITGSAGSNSIVLSR
ncbi:MAG: addiction module protein [Gammaproteobacteria bacterium]